MNNCMVKVTKSAASGGSQRSLLEVFHMMCNEELFTKYIYIHIQQKGHIYKCESSEIKCVATTSEILIQRLFAHFTQVIMIREVWENMNLCESGRQNLR